MLNEIKEFEEYNKKKRLKPATINNNFSGLKRVLEILAIQYLADSKEAEHENSDIDYVKEKLEDWIENKYTVWVEESIKASSGLNTGLDNDTALKNAQSKLDYLQKRKADFKSPVLYSSYTKEDRKTDTRSNANQLSYERVIANALNTRGYAGLKRYYLVCDDNLLNKKRICNKATARTNAIATVVDVVSKMTAAYLLKKKQVPDSTELKITQSDVYNWIVGGQYDQYFNKSKFYMIPEDIQIFKKIRIGNKAQNTVKFSFAKEWIKHFDVIEESKLDAWLKKNQDNPNAHFYSDWGSGKKLMKDKRYLNC